MRGVWATIWPFLIVAAYLFIGLWGHYVSSP
jgi:hypothetical protein